MVKSFNASLVESESEWLARVLPVTEVAMHNMQ